MIWHALEEGTMGCVGVLHYSESNAYCRGLSMQSIGWHDMACKCSTAQGLMVAHACHAPCKIYI